MSKSGLFPRSLLALLLLAWSAFAVAQSLPVTVQASGNSATAVIGSPASKHDFSALFKETRHAS